MPSMLTVSKSARMPSTAAWSAAILSPRPTSRDADSAPLSVARTISSARSRSGIVVMRANLSCAAQPRCPEPRGVPLPDTDTIRRAFTSLSRTGADGRPLVFLDGPGGAQVPDVVIDAMADYLRHSNANIEGAFVTSEETTELVDSTRLAAADFLGSRPEEVIFGPNMTTINFNLVHAFCRTLDAGDEIVVTALDHDANVSPWLLCAKDHGLVVRTADVCDGDLQVEPAALEKVIGPRTKVCAFTLASNAIGTMPQARALAD